jgi:hypothetical protein
MTRWISSRLFAGLVVGNMRCTSSPRSAVVEIEEPKITGKYVAPRLRDAGETGYVAEESTCLRVSGVSLEITEQRIRGLIRTIRTCGTSVSAQDLERGEEGLWICWFFEERRYGKGIEVMDRKGYDHEIMRIAWDERRLRH